MQKIFPGTLLEFEHWFRSEEACRDYLAAVRWPKGFVCPQCQHAQNWKTGKGVLRCGGCRKDVSVTAGTIFQGSHIPLRLWFRAMWLVTNQKTGISALSLQRALGLKSYESAWSCLHRLRSAMVRPGRNQLSGRVEVDETYVGGHELGGRGRHIGKKSLVIIAAEARGDGIGRIRLKAADQSKERLLGFVQETVAPGSTIVTDGLPVYRNLSGLGYHHVARAPENHRSEATKLLPRVHRVAALMKRWVLGVHQGSVSKHKLAQYLEEFTFRFNRRSSPTRGMVFYRLVEQSVATGPKKQ